MKRLLFLLAFLCVTSAASFAQGSGPVTVKEEDGSPSVIGVKEIVFPNGSVTVSGKTAHVSTGGGGGGGTVTSVSVASANGFAGTVANATTTPAITIRTTITGLLKGNGTAISAASAGTDYENPLTFSTGLTRSTNTITVNTSQNLATLSNLTSNGLVTTSGGAGTLSVTVPGTGVLTALGVNVGSAGAVVVNGGAGGTPSSLTLTSATGLPPTTGIVGWPANASGILTNNGSGTLSWAAAGGTGTVTSVDQFFTGGLISVSGNPITTSGTLALTVAGTSGGIPYFSSASAWASSAALAANALVIGGGSGAAPSTTTTGTGILTFLGTPSSANFLAAVTNETGTGLVMGNDSPTIITPSITTGFTIGGTATSGTIPRGNGTNFVASTFTMAVPGTTGNLLTSDGTNWTSAAPSQTFGSALTVSVAPAANTAVDGLLLTSTGTASNGNQIFGPDLIWTGQAWKSNATAASQTDNIKAGLVTVQGAAASTAILRFSAQIAAGGYQTIADLNSNGTLTISPITGVTTQSTLQINHGGSPRARLGTVSANTAYGGLWFGNITPSDTNYVVIGSGSETTINAAASSSVQFRAANVDKAQLDFSALNLRLGSGFTYAISSGADGTAAADWILGRRAAATFNFGASDAASPVAQTFTVQGVVAGTSNTAGVNTTYKASASTGNLGGGSFIWQVTPLGSSGTSQNSYATALTIDSTKAAIFTGNLNFGGTANTNLMFKPDGSTGGAFRKGDDSNVSGIIGGGSFYAGAAGGYKAIIDAGNTINGASISSDGTLYFSSSTSANGGLAALSLVRESGSILKVGQGTTAGYGDFKARHILAATSTAAPTIASGFGTSPSIAGGDDAGRITVGTGGIATTGAITFGTAYATAPSCVANNETTLLLVQATITTTTLTLTSATPFGASDKLTWVCQGW